MKLLNMSNVQLTKKAYNEYLEFCEDVTTILLKAGKITSEDISDAEMILLENGNIEVCSFASTQKISFIIDKKDFTIVGSDVF